MIDHLAHSSVIIGEHNGLSVIECVQCGFKHLHPLPDASEVRARYRRGFYEDDKPDYREHEEADREWLQRVCYSMQFELLLANAGLENRNWLDVGCGYGDFLSYVQSRTRAQILGVEPSARAGAELSVKGIPYLKGFIEDSDIYFNESYDCIRAAWVLEHVIDPRAVISRLSVALQRGGVLLVIVPNDFSEIQAALKREPYWIHPTHISYFDYKSLARLLESERLHVIDRLGTYPMELFQLAGHDYVGDSVLKQAVGNAIHAERKAMEMQLVKSAGGWRVLLAMQRAWARAGIGRDIIMVARKEL